MTANGYSPVSHRLPFENTDWALVSHPKSILRSSLLPAVSRSVVKRSRSADSDIRVFYQIQIQLLEIASLSGSGESSPEGSAGDS